MKRSIIFFATFLFLGILLAQNYSLQFDGSGDYVHIGNPFFNGGETNQFTMECWIKISEFNQMHAGIWGKYSSWKEANLLYSDNNIGAFYAYPNSYNSVGVEDTPTDFDWHHVAWVMDGYDKKLFFDGNLVDENTTTHNVISWIVEGSTHRFGCTYVGGTPYFFNGFIDAYRLSSNIRYTTNFIPDTEFSTDVYTEAIYNFNEGSGNTLYDTSGNENHCIIYGAQWSLDTPNVPLTANFEASPTSGFVPLEVDFTDLSTSAGSIVTWQWDFDNDGTFDSYEQNPTFIYNTEGTYSVKLIVESNTEADTLIIENYITSTYGPPQNLTATPSLTEIELNWEQCYQPNILLYKIFRNTSPNPITQIDATVHPTTIYTDSNVNPNTTYYYRVTGYTSTGQETDYSNEVSTQLLPQMIVAPNSFDLTVNKQTGSHIVDNFDIDNTGNGQLEFQVEGSDNLGEFDYGDCLSFDGSGDYVNIPYSDCWDVVDGDFTIECWFNVQNTSGYKAIVASNTDYVLGMFILNDHMGYFASSTGSNWNLLSGDSDNFNGIGSITFSPNEWHHLAFVRNGNQWLGFIDGVEDLNVMVSGTVISRNESRNIGRWGANGYWFNGMIDDFRFSKGIARYTSDFTPSNHNCDSFVSGLWKFDEGSGNIAYDSCNSLNGNLTNFNLSTCWVESTIDGGTGSILSFNPALGILNGGSRLTQNVVMTVDAEDLTDGIYNTSADITHNDPNETNPFIIPVTITVDRTAPEQVTGLSATPTMTDITLNWDASIATDLDKYYIYRSVENDNPIYLTEVDESTTTFMDTSIPNEEDSYYYWVSAVDVNENEGTKSDSILTYLDIPATVQNVNISFVNSDAVLTWDEVTETVYENPIQNLTGYIVYFAEDIYEADTLFAYHGFTTETTYTHEYVGVFSDRMFYKVSAYVGDLRILKAIIKEYPHIQAGMLNNMIDEKIKMSKKRN